MLAPQRVPALRAPASRRINVRCSATAPTQVITRQVQVISEAPIELDVEGLYKRLEARAKAMIQLEEQEVGSRTQVKFVLKQKVGLGEAWKIVGKCPELGNMLPEVAPYMQWNNGDVWTLETRIRPGNFVYKAVLRKPDGQYLWEDGKDRVIEVSLGESSKSVEVSNIKFI